MCGSQRLHDLAAPSTTTIDDVHLEWQHQCKLQDFRPLQMRAGSMQLPRCVQGRPLKADHKFSYSSHEVASAIRGQSPRQFAKI